MVNAPSDPQPSALPTSLWSKSAAIVGRDLRLLQRRPSQLLQILGFFVVVTVLFPLGYSPELGKLRAIAPGVLWVGALLASLLALEGLFRDDAEDGTLEQWLLCGQPLAILMLAKTVAHWLLTGLPLTLMAPLLAVTLGVSITSAPGILLALGLGTLALSLIGSITAGLTLGLRRGGVLLSLLSLPLAVPVLIFGARATELVIQGDSPRAALYLLASLVVLAITLAPLAAAAAVRIGLE